ncbi:MAG TPA: SUMF1/EgtB/PvdO family nonheme iron enzyme, partial [Myxococcota bacterium]|nr:SUMF1/EgtB/PvdO family nonheme iron enzyme [Myxococcota bacterium]
TPPPTTRPPSPPATRPPDAGRLPEAASPPEGMVKIPARQASWAGASWDVRPFHLDRRPVTNAEYAAFVEGTDALPPAWWHGRIPPADRADHPVVGVKLRDARAYAAWRGRRLPTADEWLSAARPVATSVFPWTTGCGAATCHCPRAGHRTTSPVNAHPDGRSQDGVEDLYGNVWEWVEPSARVPAREAGATLVFGASFRHPCSAPDGRVPATEVLLDADYLYLGFRCASDMKQ